MKKVLKSLVVITSVLTMGACSADSKEKNDDKHEII